MWLWKKIVVISETNHTLIICLKKKSSISYVKLIFSQKLQALRVIELDWVFSMVLRTAMLALCGKIWIFVFLQWGATISFSKAQCLVMRFYSYHRFFSFSLAFSILPNGACTTQHTHTHTLNELYSIANGKMFEFYFPASKVILHDKRESHVSFIFPTKF